MNMFEGLGSTPIFERGAYFQPGIYDVQVNRLLPKNTNAGDVAIIGEFDILQAQYKPQTDPKGLGRIWNPNPAGSSGTWYQSMSDKKIGMPAAKAFAVAALGLRPGHPLITELEAPIPGTRWCVLDNLMNMAITDDNIFKDLLVHLECTMILTEKKKEDFTRHDFSPLNFEAVGMSPPNVSEFIAMGRVVKAPTTYSYGPPAPYPQPHWPQQPGPAPQQGPPPGYGPPAPYQPHWPQQPGPAPHVPQQGPPPGMGWPSHVPWNPGTRR